MSKSTSSMKLRLEKERNIWLATARPDGRPHLVPVWFILVSGKLYVCIEPKSLKGRNLISNSNVSLALEDGTSPIICEGEACFVAKPWPDVVVTAFQQKYDWDIAVERRYNQLVAITPRKWFGLGIN